MPIGKTLKIDEEPDLFLIIPEVVFLWRDVARAPLTPEQRPQLFLRFLNANATLA